MRTMLAILALLALLPAPALAQEPPRLAGKTILIIQAHADDERNLAPMLYEACRFEGARCHFVVLSTRNSGGCALAAAYGDAPIVFDFAECGRIRRREMATSAAFLGASVQFLEFEEFFYSHDNDGLNRLWSNWSRFAGGDRKMVEGLAAIIAEQHPDLIFTLDPRHGSSCHPAHRAAALMTVQAVETLPPATRPQVWLEEATDIPTGLDENETGMMFDGGLFVWQGNKAPVVTYDWTRQLPDGHPARYARDMVLTIHVSQNETPGKQMPALAPERQQFPMVRLADIDPYEDLCTPLALNRPTWDKPGNKDAVMGRLAQKARKAQ